MGKPSLFGSRALPRFGVPPPIIGDWEHATFSNTASVRELFAALTLLPWVNKVERKFSRVVINNPDVSLSFDLSGMFSVQPVLAAGGVSLKTVPQRSKQPDRPPLAVVP